MNSHRNRVRDAEKEIRVSSRNLEKLDGPLVLRVRVSYGEHYAPTAAVSVLGVMTWRSPDGTFIPHLLSPNQFTLPKCWSQILLAHPLCGPKSTPTSKCAPLAILFLVCSHGCGVSYCHRAQLSAWTMTYGGGNVQAASCSEDSPLRTSVWVYQDTIAKHSHLKLNSTKYFNSNSKTGENKLSI